MKYLKLFEDFDIDEDDFTDEELIEMEREERRKEIEFDEKLKMERERRREEIEMDKEY